MFKCNVQKSILFVAFSLGVFGLFGSVMAAAAPSSAKTSVAFFGLQKAEEFELKIKPLFIEKSRPCKNCEIINYTPYNKDGELDMDALFQRVEELPAGTSFVFFDFNMKVNEQNKALIELLNRKVDSGLVVVGTAGAPKSSEASGPLSKTVLGQVHGALIIGELAERDRLMPTGFYGPEMLTAVRPPREILGQGLGPLIFAATLAENWQKRTAAEWMEHLRVKKMKSRKIWLDMGDMF